MSRTDTIDTMRARSGVRVIDLTPSPLTAAGAGPWVRLYTANPVNVDFKLSAGSAAFVLETAHDDLETNGAAVYGTAAEPATLTGTNAHDTTTLYSGILYLRIRRTDSAGDDLTATAVVVS